MMKREAFNAMFSIDGSIQEEEEKEEEKETETLDSSIERGHVLMTLQKEVNDLLAFVILSLSAFCVVGGIASAYGCLSLLFGRLTPYRIAMAVFFLILLLKLLSEYHALCNAGQKLKDEMEETKESFKKARKENAQTLTEETKVDIENLLDSLSKPDPISPYSYFSVNHACFMAAEVTTLTYLIVLLQFKGAEG